LAIAAQSAANLRNRSDVIMGDISLFTGISINRIFHHLRSSRSHQNLGLLHILVRQIVGSSAAGYLQQWLKFVRGRESPTAEKR
jgi:hypothetical protein